MGSNKPGVVVVANSSSVRALRSECRESEALPHVRYCDMKIALFVSLAVLGAAQVRHSGAICMTEPKGGGCDQNARAMYSCGCDTCCFQLLSQLICTMLSTAKDQHLFPLIVRN